MMKTVAAWYLVIQTLGCLLWWVLLLTSDGARDLFVAEGAPDAVILALGPGDVLLFVLLPSLVAYGLWRNAGWAWPLLCVHAGGATYAGLYAIALAILTHGELWPGAVMMIPSTFLPVFFTWILRPTATAR